MPKTTSDQQRAFEFTLDIEASPDEVWRALTDAEELMRWFPLEAEVTPGAGGAMRWSWEEHFDWPTRIDAWEPGRRLRLVQDDYRPAADVEPARVVMEFTLETRAGKTRLRLVRARCDLGRVADGARQSSVLPRTTPRTRSIGRPSHRDACLPARGGVREADGAGRAQSGARLSGRGWTIHGRPPGGRPPLRHRGGIRAGPVVHRHRPRAGRGVVPGRHVDQSPRRDGRVALARIVRARRGTRARAVSALGARVAGAAPLDLKCG